MKYVFIRSNAARYPVNHLCRLLGVKRSAYYSWHNRAAKIIGPEELALRRRMKTLFAESRRSLGSRMMTASLRAAGFAVGHERVRHLMQTLDLKVKQKRKYRITTDPRHRTKSGDQTALIYGRDKVGFTWQLLSICIPDASSDGPWIGG